MGKLIRKADIILLAVLACAGIILAAASFAGGEGGRAVVRVNGATYGVYDLSTDREVVIEEDGHRNKFIIQDGQVQMTDADCKNHDCMKMGAVSRNGQMIVCLPNRVTVTIEREEGSADVDIIAE